MGLLSRKIERFWSIIRTKPLRFIIFTPLITNLPAAMYFRYLSHFFSCLLAILCFACTPKAAGPATTATSSSPTTTPKPTTDKLSPCTKFTDAPNPDDAETNYVIYRQMLKAEDMTESMKTWRKVYATSPAADGRRATVYTDGIAFYHDLIAKFPDKKMVYGDTIVELYAEARRCYPGDGYMSAIQGFDSYYTYKGTASDEEIYALFKESLDIDGPEKLNYFVINPMSRLLVDAHKAGKVTEAEAREVVSALNTRLAKGLEECQGAGCEPWKAIDGYAPETLRYFETVKGFYDCDYYIGQYFAEFKENSTDCDAISTALSRLKYGGCAESSPQMVEVRAASKEHCTVAPTAPNTLRQAYDLLEANDYKGAIAKFEEAADGTDDAERKGRYLLTAAKVYYSHLRSYGQARSYARKAAAANPKSGDPYMLIGTLYASSGPLCGPGTGFDSQVVTWPAIDKWQQAKRIDPSLAGKANKLINRYTKYMPSKSDIFQRSIKEGDSFTVGCWIQESTRVRTP